MKKKVKVLAYITNKNKLLVFNQPDHPEAGIQVPGGTVEEMEDIADAVIREVSEETGLNDFKLVKYLGSIERDMSDYGKNEIHHRHFFHITTEENENKTWQHIEKFNSERDEEILFNFYWADIDNAESLIFSHAAMLNLI